MVLIILGIDPGYAIMGYGIIDADGNRLRVIDYGVTETRSSMPFPERLERLYLGARQLIQLYQPACICILRSCSFIEIPQPLCSSAQEGAWRCLRPSRRDSPLYEYTPMQLKSAVTGDGHADKKQMQEMVRLLLNLKSVPKPDDAADALGVAICHASTPEPAAEEFKIK